MTTVEPERVQGVGNNVMGAKDAYSMSPGRGGGHGGGSKPAGRPLPHIQDIVAAPNDIDTSQTIRRLIDMAETALRQAEMARDFNRPAIALKEYIRASIIAIQVIQNHRDYTFLQGDRRDLAAAYSSLLKKIRQQDEVFAKIKQDIIEDNKRTGVQPKVGRPEPLQSSGGEVRPVSPPETSGRDVPPSLLQSLNGSPRSNLEASPGRTKPTMQLNSPPLNGTGITPDRNSITAARNLTQDLAARFANLRGPQASPGQDPRIKTHPLVPVPPKPAGPREMPPPHKPKIGIDSNMPTLPKVPDAIYSPARGSISSEAARMQTTTPRGLYARTGSSTSLAGTPTGSNSPQMNDYFPPTQSYSNNAIPPVPRVPPPAIPALPKGDVITPLELFQAMKGKGSILIIDIRVREDYDEGHIMSSSTICIEPSILLRQNLSAEEISESLVISPSKEQSLFDQRDKFELVVFYDQDAEQIPKSPNDSDDLVIISLHRALVHFNYEKELKNTPKILKGGLDAWIDLMGPASLQATAATGPQQIEKPLGNRNRSVTIERKKSRYIVKPLKPDEVKVWQETLENEDMQTASSPTFPRTTEEFFRRYPPVGPEKESMSAPPKPQHKPAYGLSHKVDLYTDLPSPPTRPAPALPRPSFSSLTQSADDSELYGDSNGASTPRTLSRQPTKSMEQQLPGDTFKYYTGLNNPQNWCYANSTLQCLLAAPDFGRELADSEWTAKYRAPRKEDEKIEHPQLMIKIISTLFHWMSTGKFKVMKAQTLMDYSRHLCTQSRSIEQFGGTQQQDAQEFMSFLLTHLHDETNIRRDRKGAVAQPNTKSQSLIQAAAEYWHNHLALNQSIIDRYWRGLELSTVQCMECRTHTYTFSPFEWIPVTVNIGRGMTLEQALTHHTADNPLDDFSCDHCRRRTHARQSLSLARMPSLLCVVFRRFHYQKSTSDLRKSTAPITWDFNDCDFSPYFLPPKDCTGAGSIGDQAFLGPFRYECYAVIVHTGSRIDNGHYFAYVRDSTSHDPYAWYCCNDSSVTKVRIGSGDRDDKQEEVFKSGRDRVPYLVFFRRKEMR